MFSTTKPRTVSVFFAGVITDRAENGWWREMSFHLLCLIVLLIQSVYPKDQRKSVYRPSRLKCRLSSVSRLINITFVMKIVYVGSVSQWGRKVPYTRSSLVVLIYQEEKVLETPSRVTSAPFISLLTSIMKMLYHLSNKNHLFQELKP